MIESREERKDSTERLSFFFFNYYLLFAFFKILHYVFFIVKKSFFFFLFLKEKWIFFPFEIFSMSFKFHINLLLLFYFLNIFLNLCYAIFLFEKMGYFLIYLF
jgi:hypothetical protein